MKGHVKEIKGDNEEDIGNNLYKILKDFFPESKEFNLSYMLKMKIKGAIHYPILKSGAKSQPEFVEQFLGYDKDCKKYLGDSLDLKISCINSGPTYTIMGGIKERLLNNPGSEKEFYIEMKINP